MLWIGWVKRSPAAVERVRERKTASFAEQVESARPPAVRR